jgi:phosphoenolpyruvate carboxylase
VDVPIYAVNSYDELLGNFHDQVALKYSLYNSLFLTLPFKQMSEIGALLTLFSKYAAEKIKLGKHPQDIVENFLKKNCDPISPKEKISTLFTLLQFVERQVVLFDALEDAAFAKTHRLDGPGTLNHLINKVINLHHEKAFIEEVENYRIKIVLTAHPTQFYPYPVLGIITQLATAIQTNDLRAISDTLWQMGKTSFKHQHPPTPVQEAQSLIWYIENIFYKVIPQIHYQIHKALREFHPSKSLRQPVIELGFWPGGDRDGNPNVNAETTLTVAQLLKTHVLKLYAADLRQLSKKLTFKGILEKLLDMRQKVENTPPLQGKESQGAVYHSAEELLADLFQLRQELIVQHDSLFIEILEEFIFKVQGFGFHLASIDMRENSAVHTTLLSALIKNYVKLSEADKKKKLSELIHSPKGVIPKNQNYDRQLKPFKKPMVKKVYAGTLLATLIL